MIISVDCLENKDGRMHNENLLPMIINIKLLTFLDEYLLATV